MAITVTEGTANTTPAGTFDVAVPAHSAGDLLVVVAAKNQGSSDTPAISTAGWTTDLRQPVSSVAHHLLVGHKTGDGAETTVRLTDMAGGSGLIGKVYRVQGADTGSPIVGTPAYDASSGTSSADLDVGTAATGDLGFVVVVWASTTSAPGFDNGYTLDESTAYYALGYKVLDSTDDSVTASWTTSRSYRAGLVVVKAAVAGSSMPVMMAAQRRRRV